MHISFLQTCCPIILCKKEFGFAYEKHVCYVASLMQHQRKSSPKSLINQCLRSRH